VPVELAALVLTVIFVEVEFGILLFVGATRVALNENIDKRLLSPHICDPFAAQGIPHETSTRGPKELVDKVFPQKHSRSMLVIVHITRLRYLTIPVLETSNSIASRATSLRACLDAGIG
jgi:hypothetical protein